jgi:hypothetical protein
MAWSPGADKNCLVDGDAHLARLLRRQTRVYGDQEHLKALAVFVSAAWARPEISVARREAVARLDEFVGPKY